MKRANQVYTGRTLKALDSLDGLSADLALNTLQGNILGGLRQADKLLRHTHGLVGKVDVSALTVMQALQYVDADARVGDVHQVLFDLIIQRGADISEVA